MVIIVLLFVIKWWCLFVSSHYSHSQFDLKTATSDAACLQ